MVEVAIGLAEIARLESDIKNLQARCGTQSAHLTRRALDGFLDRLTGWTLRPELVRQDDGSFIERRPREEKDRTL